MEISTPFEISILGGKSRFHLLTTYNSLMQWDFSHLTLVCCSVMKCGHFGTLFVFFLEPIVIFEKSSFSKKVHFHNDCMELRVGWPKFLFFQIQHKILRMFTKIRCPNSKSQLGKAEKVQKSEKNSNFWPFLVKNYPLDGRMTNIFFFRFHIKF